MLKAGLTTLNGPERYPVISVAIPEAVLALATQKYVTATMRPC